ncbi:CaiB/BaiF CoA transferase family protein [Cryptosporangium aurantiacum]|uniref:Crotonobetainyl-CoA:carnitine CoA-transferase CaiB n=1 Tax=Cryptosporangium aurantiacum TaxID=134849 RepID=A0A1M7RBD7_9ACTN|nr:CoA transferase [Cryptosporangium aurantiacum]SHN43368.1 Crotonobetainyl-CoA:carnitine CoA-transferase CaiB [Cryptosporangium aurantiacum]
MTGALDGLTIVDFSRVLAGPYATMLLGDLGADVIKVEAPTGDDTRAWGPPFDASGTATYFAGVNRNKTAVSLDLRAPDGLSAARGLVARADVVVENFRAGAMARLGLGPETLRRDRPDLVYCAITGFGSGSALPGYDLLVQAVGGLMSITGPGPGQPTKVGVALVDVVTGLHASVGILAALRHRDRTGEGQVVEVNLLSSLLSALTNQAAGYLGAGAVPGPMGNRHPSIAPYEVFATADRPLALAVGNDRQFAALATVLGVPGLATDERFRTNTDRVAHRAALFDTITAALAGRGAEAWFEALTAAGVPAGPINDVADAFALATRLGLEPAVAVPGAVAPGVANPIRLSATPATYRLPPPPSPVRAQRRESGL